MTDPRFVSYPGLSEVDVLRQVVAHPEDDSGYRYIGSINTVASRFDIADGVELTEDEKAAIDARLNA